MQSDGSGRAPATTRRSVLVTPLLAAAAVSLQPAVLRAAEEKSLSTTGPPPPAAPAPAATVPAAVPAVEKKEEVISSRIYDATVIGEPMAVGKDKSKVWEKMMNARIVHLGEAEQVPIKDDKELELEIVRNLRRRCVEGKRPISVALEAFPCDLQELLNQFIDKRSFISSSAFAGFSFN